MASSRSSGLVGAARKIGASPTRSISARYSAASSTIMSITSTPSAPAQPGIIGKARQPIAQNWIQISEDDQPGIWPCRANFAGNPRAHPPGCVPRATARSLARWITGPSASGSLNGTPSSITSAPASMAAIAMARVASSVGIARRQIHHQPRFVIEVEVAIGFLRLGSLGCYSFAGQ